MACVWDTLTRTLIGLNNMIGEQMAIIARLAILGLGVCGMVNGNAWSQTGPTGVIHNAKPQSPIADSVVVPAVPTPSPSKSR